MSKNSSLRNCHIEIKNVRFDYMLYVKKKKKHFKRNDTQIENKRMEKIKNTHHKKVWLY